MVHVQCMYICIGVSARINASAAPKQRRSGQRSGLTRAVGMLWRCTCSTARSLIFRDEVGFHATDDGTYLPVVRQVCLFVTAQIEFSDEAKVSALASRRVLI